MADLIDRHAALDIVRGLEERYVNNLPPMIDKADAYKALDALPSADALEVVRCKDCKHADEYYHCIFSAIWNDKNHYCSQGERRNG